LVVQMLLLLRLADAYSHVGQIHTIIAIEAVTSIRQTVDFSTTLGAQVNIATFNEIGESVHCCQWTGTDGWAVIAHATNATGDLTSGPALT
jgi:hypothetical protein